MRWLEVPDVYYITQLKEFKIKLYREKEILIYSWYAILLELSSSDLMLWVYLQTIRRALEYKLRGRKSFFAIVRSTIRFADLDSICSLKFWWNDQADKLKFDLEFWSSFAESCWIFPWLFLIHELVSIPKGFQTHFW